MRTTDNSVGAATASAATPIAYFCHVTGRISGWQIGKSRDSARSIVGYELALFWVMLRTLSSLQFLFVLRQGSSGNFVDVKGIATTVSRLLSPCAFGHGHTLRTRDEEGFLALQCADCGQVKRVLEKPAIKGPKLHAEPVKGAPLTSVRRAVKN